MYLLFVRDCVKCRPAVGTVAAVTVPGFKSQVKQGKSRYLNLSQSRAESVQRSTPKGSYET